MNDKQKNGMSPIIDCDVHHGDLADLSALYPYLPRHYVEYIEDFGPLLPGLGIQTYLPRQTQLATTCGRAQVSTRLPSRRDSMVGHIRIGNNDEGQRVTQLTSRRFT